MVFFRDVAPEWLPETPQPGHSGAKCTQQVFKDKRENAGGLEKLWKKDITEKEQSGKDLIKLCMNIKYNNLHMQSVSIFKRIYFVCMGICLHVCMHTARMPHAQRGRKRVLYPLVLELQAAVSYLTRVLGLKPGS